MTLKLEDLSNLREVLENADWKKLRAGALRAREVFDYRKMGPRLKIFYKKAAEVADQNRHRDLTERGSQFLLDPNH